jgi:hypothetical protein
LWVLFSPLFFSSHYCLRNCLTRGLTELNQFSFQNSFAS